MSGIRLGDIPDMKAICDLGQELLDQSVYEGIPPDESKFKRLVAGMMGSNNGLVLVVVDDDDNPQGILLGMIDELFFSRYRVVTDLAVYIRKGYREWAPRLIKRLEAWGREKPRVIGASLGISSGIGDFKRIGRMYELQGLHQVGSIHFKRY